MANQKLQILIIEDNLSFSLELEILVQEIGYEVAAAVDNSAEALEIIFSQPIDFILADIDIKGKLTGIDIAKKIRHTQIPVLFLTSFGDEVHYQQALKSNFAGYLVKPIDKYTLRTAVNLAIHNLFSNPGFKKGPQEGDNFFSNNSLFFKKNGVYHKVKENDILVIEAADDYVTVYIKDKQAFLLRKSLKMMEEIIQNKHFIRVHRSFIINLDAVENIDFLNNSLVIAGKNIPLSRRKKTDLEQLIRRID